MTRIFLSPPDVGTAERDALLGAFDSGWIAPVGPEIEAFEAAMSSVVGLPAAVAVSSGTAALHLVLRELGVGPGDDVIVSTFTFVATANPVVYLGARPVFVDSDAVSWNLAPALLADELADRARRNRLPKAVVVVDLYGQCADYGQLEPLCSEYGVTLIEDAAEALGATCAGRPAGSFGAAGIFSFNGNKIITTSGGGMVVTRDALLAARVEHLATQARDDAPHYEHGEVGYNYRLSNLLAALGRAQLASLPHRVDRRRAINARYREALGVVPGLEFMPEAAYGRSTSWLTCITVDPVRAGFDRDDLRLELGRRDIESRPTWKPMHLQPVFKAAPARTDGTSERLFRTGLCLPSGSSLTDEQQDRVIEVALELAKSRCRDAWPR